MKRLLSILVLGSFAVVGCGEKLQQIKDTAEAVKDAQKAVEKLEESQTAGADIQKERAAKGDTVAMPYKDLQNYLPKSIDGYALQGDPSGGQTKNMGYSISTATQMYTVGAADAPDAGSQPKITVTIMDNGGGAMSQLQALTGAASQFESEDDHQKSAGIKTDLAHTSGLLAFNKDTKVATATVDTRYRYNISVTAINQKDDQSQKVQQIALDIAKQFEGK